MKKIILASLLAFGLTTSAIANEDGRGVYVGLAYGNTAFAEDSAGTLKDDTGTGYKVYAGYQFNKNVGVEATYTDYGTFSYTNTKISTTSTSVAANLGYTFLNGQLRPFALAGLSYLNFEQTGTLIYLDDNTVAYNYGIGIEYSPKVLNGIGFRAAWDADIYVIDAVYGDDYAEAYGMFSIAAQYKF